MNTHATHVMQILRVVASTPTHEHFNVERTQSKNGSVGAQVQKRSKLRKCDVIQDNVI